MGIGENIANAAKDAVGKAKETLGDMTNNDDLKAQGKVDQAAAKANDVKEDVKDKAADVKDAVEDKVDDVKDSVNDATN